MADPSALDRLEHTARSEPAELDFRALSRYLGSESLDERSRAEDIREIVLRKLDDPDAVFDALWPLLVEDEERIRRHAGETLKRVARVWPRGLAPRLASGLDDSDVRWRGAAAGYLSGLGNGAIRPYIPALVERLDDPDDRVRALALSTLSSVAGSFPEDIAPSLESVEPFLDDRWVPTDGGFQVIYSSVEHEPDEEAGEPAGERLTNQIPRPYESAVSLLADVARTQPAAVTTIDPRLAEIERNHDNRPLDDLLVILTRIARDDPAAIEPAISFVEEWATSDHPHRARARNLLRECGRDLPLADSVEAPTEMATRDRPPQPDDEDVLSRIDEDALIGDLDVGRIVPLLHSTDSETRDTALWGLECGTGVSAVEDAVHERAETFLSLLDEPDECARRHLRNLLGSVAASDPEAWLPALVELAEHDDPLVREGALVLVSSIGDRSPSLVAPELDLVTEALDEDTTRSAAMLVLSHLAEPYPADVRGIVPTLARAIDPGAIDDDAVQALGTLRALAWVDPGAVLPAVESVTSLVESLASASGIEPQAQWGRDSHVEGIDDRDEALTLALEVCALVAKEYPDRVASVISHAERVAEGRYYGHKEAWWLLATVPDHQ